MSRGKDRDQYLAIRASSAEREMAKDLADKDGLTVSDWLRLTIRQRHAEAFPATKPTNKDQGPNG